MENTYKVGRDSVGWYYQGSFEVKRRCHNHATARYLAKAANRNLTSFQAAFDAFDLKKKKVEKV